MSLSAFKIKILRCIIEDYDILEYFVDDDKMPTLREFAEEQFTSLVRQRNKCDSWREFYLKYKYE